MNRTGLIAKISIKYVLPTCIWKYFWRISRYFVFFWEFRRISRKYLNFAGPQLREISEALNILFNEHSGFPGGYSGFKWQGWLNGGKNQNPRISLGLPIKTIKIPGPKINPRNCQAEFPNLKKFEKALMDITGKITLNINIRNHMFVPGYAGIPRILRLFCIPQKIPP